MTFKVYYQPSKNTTPRRENTQSLYLEADSEAAARVLVEENTNYNVEFIELSGSLFCTTRPTRGCYPIPYRPRLRQ
ncbi:RNA polymerase epsilon subunit [Limosilactobacillus fermentum]